MKRINIQRAWNIIEEKGVKILISKSIGLIWSKSLEIFRPFLWFFPFLKYLSRSIVPYSQKRILAIWDFMAVPYSIGELLFFQEMTLVLRETYKVNKVDIVFICDPNAPARSDQGLSPTNFHIDLNALIPLVYVNRYLGKFILFDSYSDFERFISQNINYYYIWPSGKEYLSKEKYYRQIHTVVEQFYMVNGYIPFLKCRDIITDWAKLFIADNILPYIPVAVQIRINEDIQPIRNSNLDAWYKFFKYCQTKYKVKFLILCSFKEYELIINHFKDLQNIVFLKEYNTKIEQDLAIIQESSMYMGGASGPSTIAWFNDKPYVVFNPVGSGAQKVKKTKRLVFGGKYQHQVWEKETFELLKNEFTILFKSIDTTYYINNVTILKTGDKLGSKFSLV